MKIRRVSPGPTYTIEGITAEDMQALAHVVWNVGGDPEKSYRRSFDKFFKVVREAGFTGSSEYTKGTSIYFTDGGVNV